MPRLASITSQTLLGLSVPSSLSTPQTGTWLDDNGDPVTVASIVSPIAMQVNGVFAVSPTVPFTIQGADSGATTTITNIAANTGTLLELDDDGNSTSFTVGEQLNIV